MITSSVHLLHRRFNGLFRESERWSLVSASVGAMIWIFLVSPLSTWIDTPVESHGETWWIERLLLFAVLVSTPLALALTGTRDRKGEHPLPHLAAVRLQPIAALFVILSFYTRTGLAAGLHTIGWLLVTVMIALFGLTRIWQRRSLRPIEELSIDAGLIYVMVGGGWMFLSRWGLNPRGFSDTIVLLTAVHFHYAGFAAPILTGIAGSRLMRRAPLLRRFYWIAAAGAITGPPLVAVGITFSRAVEALSTFALSISLLTLALLILFAIVPAQKNRVAQLLLILSANSVIVTMIFASVYALGRYEGITTVTIPLMAQIHGSINAFGFVLCGLMAWLIESRLPLRNGDAAEAC